MPQHAAIAQHALFAAPDAAKAVEALMSITAPIKILAFIFISVELGVVVGFAHPIRGGGGSGRSFHLGI
jgi:hypothetical protein